VTHLIPANDKYFLVKHQIGQPPLLDSVNALCKFYGINLGEIVHLVNSHGFKFAECKWEGQDKGYVKGGEKQWLLNLEFS
jgi:hypothetical protein